MKIGFFTPHILWGTHYETELELIQNHLDIGDEVFQFICNAQLPSCDINIGHKVQVCFSCMGCRDFGKNLIDGNLVQKSFLNLTDKNREEIKEISELKFDNIKELQKLKIENFDLGYAVASSLISNLRDPEPDLMKNRQILENYLTSSLGIYRSMLNFLQEAAFDRFYTFNGRFAHVKPVLRACQAMNVDCYIHERGNNKEHYSLYKNTIPHDLKYVENLMKVAWERADLVKRKSIGESFYNDRAKSVEGSWFSFTKEQIIGLLPEGWDTNKQNIVIFNSSEDEFASVGEEWANPIYNSQLEGLRRIIQDLKFEEDIHLYLRVHPNLKNVNNEDKRSLYQLQGSNFTLIPAESLISTYGLIKAATKIVSFGSTVGIEAVYWNKPSILAGKNYYYNLGGTYNPSSHADLINLIKSPLKPKNNEPALIYGHYYKTFGIPFKFYKAEGFFEGKFKGQYVTNGKHVKYKALNWLLWKPLLRKLRPAINNWHMKYQLKSKYL